MEEDLTEEVDYLVQQARTSGLNVSVYVDDDEQIIWVENIARLNSVSGRAADFLSDLREIANEYDYSVEASVLDASPKLALYYQEIGFEIEDDDRGRLLIRG